MPKFIARWFTPSKSDGGAPIPQPTPLPTPPSQGAADALGESAVAAKKRKLSKTILTGPEGLDTDFETSKKTLLGE